VLTGCACRSYDENFLCGSIECRHNGWILALFAIVLLVFYDLLFGCCVK
jgi:hypothetical protein